MVNELTEAYFKQYPRGFDDPWPCEEHKVHDQKLRALFEQLQATKGSTVKDFQKMAKDKYAQPHPHTHLSIPSLTSHCSRGAAVCCMVGWASSSPTTRLASRSPTYGRAAAKARWPIRSGPREKRGWRPEGLVPPREGTAQLRRLPQGLGDGAWPWACLGWALELGWGRVGSAGM